MEAELAKILQKATISPTREMGAFEALWMTEVSSFKQLHGKLATSDMPGLERPIMGCARYVSRSDDLLKRAAVGCAFVLMLSLET